MTILKVVLSAEQVQIGMLNGINKNADSRKKRYVEGNNLHHSIKEGVEMSVYGSIAEMAVAEVFNLMPNFIVGDLNKLDAGDCVEVKAIKEKNRRLIIKPKEATKLDTAFMLTYLPYDFDTNIIPLDPVECSIVGWCWGSEGIQSKFWCDPTGRNRPAYFVPNNVLHQDWDVFLEYAHEQNKIRLKRFYDQIQGNSVAKSPIDRQPVHRSQAR